MDKLSTIGYAFLFTFNGVLIIKKNKICLRNYTNSLSHKAELKHVHSHGWMQDENRVWLIQKKKIKLV